MVLTIRIFCLYMIALLMRCSVQVYAKDTVKLTWEESVKLTCGETRNITFYISDILPNDTRIFLKTTYRHPSEGQDPLEYPSIVELHENSTYESVAVSGKAVGQTVVLVNTTSPYLILPEDSRFRAYVVKSYTIVTINTVVGWVYFVAWSVSFYPQVVLNFQRKSVIGLNFDFLAYNITGFVAYCLYNIGLFWIPLVKKQYLEEYPEGVNPVQPNDVFFTIHAVVLTGITIVQCLIYERGGQKISKLAIILLTVTGTAMFVLLFVAVGNKITWLEYLTVFSYVKLGITLIKYLPQVYMNYKRKSTVGWSIGNVLLDFTGGSLSVLQMILQSYNNAEWGLIFGDPTKFGLGIFSIMFDIIFMVQHYILYRNVKQRDFSVLQDSTEYDD